MIHELSGMAVRKNLYGYNEIAAFRAARPGGPGPRKLSKLVITTYGHDFAVASTLTYSARTPGRVGRQMQTWVRFPDGWRVVAACSYARAFLERHPESLLRGKSKEKP